MREVRWMAVVLLCTIATVFGGGVAEAQASRTWVSGVGDDVNPCSRTAPCKTFAGAISKTAAGGEINVLDPGGFGTVTITKSITISAEGVEAGVLASGTNGFTVNAGPADVVVLRGLDIHGTGTGLNGVRFLAGGALHIENCTIMGFSQTGVSFAPAAASRLFVKDTIVRANNPAGGSSFGGIFVNPGPTGSASVSLDNVRIEQNFHGLRVQGRAVVTATGTTAAGNSGSGFFLTAPNGAALHLDRCAASGNGTGVRAGGASGVVRISTTVVSDNTLGLAAVSGGVIESFGNNRVAGNTTDGAPTVLIPEQ